MKIDQILANIKKNKEFIYISAEKDVAIFISNLANLALSKTFLEIGTHLGYTSLTVLKNVKGVHVTTVDLATKYKRYSDKLTGKIREQINFINSTAGDYYSKLNHRKKFDLIFIDADHSFLGVFRDFVHVLPHTVCGTYVIFHDTLNPIYPGIRKFLKIVSFLNLIFLETFADIITISTPLNPNAKSRYESGITIVKIKASSTTINTLYRVFLSNIYRFYYFIVVQLRFKKQFMFEVFDHKL
jgi:predicted O-methyltransferase YrrM